MKKLLSVIVSLLILSSAMLSAYAADTSQKTPEFIRGVDVSSYFSLINSGVKFKGFNGKVLDNDGFFELLSQNGVNCVRVRIWNNPYDSNGNGYGGGNCDIENACKIGALASRHNISMLADFHLSDFWADPSTQRAPKAWKSYTLSQKQSAVYNFVYDSLNRLKSSGADVSMVQIGNEINSGLCGETKTENIASLLKRGFAAVTDFDGAILRVVHYTDPHKKIFEWVADNLNKNGVEYDVFASSYYPFWHGTADNFTAELKKVADKYSKYVMCAETSYPFTTEDSDFYSNNVSGYESALTYPVSVSGQAQSVRDVFNAVKSVGEMGIGAFYWEPAWITVGTESYDENYRLWEQYGSGWESSFAAEYCDDGAKWHGGSSWDNQALFDKNGQPLESLSVFSEFAPTVKGDVNGDRVLTVADATLIQKYCARLEEFSESQELIADVDNNGTITVLDATLIQKVLAKLDTF